MKLLNRENMVQKSCMDNNVHWLNPLLYKCERELNIR